MQIMQIVEREDHTLTAPSRMLPVVRYRFDCTVETPLDLPEFAGSTLRGAFGRALRAISCLQPERRSCTGCFLAGSCAYANIFEPVPAGSGGGDMAGRQKISQLPVPYVIEPPPWGARRLLAGESLDYSLVLIGKALQQRELITKALMRAMAHGLGREKGRARLLAVTPLDTAPELLADAGKQFISEQFADECAIELDFYSPLRLQNNGRRAAASEYTPRRLISALLRRIALLHQSNAVPLKIDFAALLLAAERLQSEKNLRWRDWTRYSSRQQQKMTLGGVVGSWKLTGSRADLAALAPFLNLGQWLHVGKEASFGLGGYRLQRGFQQESAA